MAASREGLIREATVDDLPGMIIMLAEDPLGSQREEVDQTSLDRYARALAEIEADPAHRILVAEMAGQLAGMLQLSFIPHLTYAGGRRAQIEGVRVAREFRSAGLGRRLMAEAIARARQGGCHLVQLTTDQRRPDARRFYESLGFEATHHGMKLHLSSRGSGS